MSRKNKSMHPGISHWWLQRLTAIALIPLVIWLICNISESINSQNGLSLLFTTPTKLILILTALIIMIWHSTLGVKVVIEDYVHCPIAKISLIIASTFISIITVIFLIFTFIHKYILLII